MRSNFTLTCKVLIALALVFFTCFSTYSQCASPSMVFHNPLLVVGIAGHKDAQYKFPSVTPGVDAFLTIKELVGGATLFDVDNTAQGYDAAWQPTVRTSSTQASGECYISWSLEFKGSADGKKHKYPCYILSFIDVDGDNVKVREFVEVKKATSYTLSNPSVLNITQSGQMIKALGQVANYADIDTSSWPTNINYNYLDDDNVEEIRTGINQAVGFTPQNRLVCSYFTKTTSASSVVVLPVKYSSFDAVVSDQTIKLNWITEDEMNNDHFEVERSLDGRNFSTIGLVLGAEIVAGNKSTYRFKDNSTALKNNSIAYYRLKQIDRDGRINYSTSLAVRLSANTGMVLQVSPNPFVGKIDIRFEAKQNGTSEIRIINLTGQTVVSKPTIISKGFNNLSLNDLEKLSKGMYIAQLLVNGVITDHQKIIKD